MQNQQIVLGFAPKTKSEMNGSFLIAYFPLQHPSHLYQPNSDSYTSYSLLFISSTHSLVDFNVHQAPNQVLGTAQYNYGKLLRWLLSRFPKTLTTSSLHSQIQVVIFLKCKLEYVYNSCECFYSGKYMCTVFQKSTQFFCMS